MKKSPGTNGTYDAYCVRSSGDVFGNNYVSHISYGRIYFAELVYVLQLYVFFM